MLFAYGIADRRMHYPTFRHGQTRRTPICGCSCVRDTCVYRNEHMQKMHATQLRVEHQVEQMFNVKSEIMRKLDNKPQTPCK